MKTHSFLLFLFAAFILSAFHVSAETFEKKISSVNLNNYGRIKLANHSKPRRQQIGNEQEQTDQQLYFSAILEVGNEADIDTLEKIGVKLYYRRENMILAHIPQEFMEDFGRFPDVERCAVSRTLTVNLDHALPATNVPQAIMGHGFNRTYTGKGVVVGFSDIGFDPGHIAFRNRVSSLTHIVDSTAYVLRAVSPSEISSWTTDSPEEHHATHVCGILAGADPSSPYQGIAREATIVGTTSQLDEMGILFGIEEIIANAKSAGLPAVINLSLGSTAGPHDGTDMFCRYLDLCAEDAAIILSAGNDGGKKLHVSKTFSADDTTLSGLFDSNNWNDIMLTSGYADIWSSDSRQLSMRIRILDSTNNDIVWTSETIAPREGELYVMKTDDDRALNEMYEGLFVVAAELSPYNDRYNMTLGLDMRCLQYYPGQSWNRYKIILDIMGEKGAKVDACTVGKISFSGANSALPWLTTGDSDLSVSSITCGQNTVCVGSATTRHTAPTIDGSMSDWHSFVQTGTVSNYTSYGTTLDGRKLPHICAPGAYVVSSFSKYPLELYPELINSMAAESPDFPSNFYYAECGTSMAAPHVAGIFALWLQADPSLSGVELREIAIKTARYEGVSPDNPRSGAGMIDAAAGLSHILAAQGITDAAEDLMEIYRNGQNLVVSGCDSATLRAEVFSLNGMKICEGPADNIILPSMPVIVRISSPTFAVVRKLM